MLAIDFVCADMPELDRFTVGFASPNNCPMRPSMRR
jgi:hypothetical protein